MWRLASLSCNLSGISVKNNGLVYRDKLLEKENYEGKWVTTYFKAPTQTRQENHGQNWVTTYFKALTQTCRGEPQSIKRKVGQGRQPECQRPHGLGRQTLQAHITLIRKRTPEKAWTPSQAG